MFNMYKNVSSPALEALSTRQQKEIMKYSNCTKNHFPRLSPQTTEPNRNLGMENQNQKHGGGLGAQRSWIFGLTTTRHGRGGDRPPATAACHASATACLAAAAAAASPKPARKMCDRRFVKIVCPRHQKRLTKSVRPTIFENDVSDSLKPFLTKCAVDDF